MIAQPMTVSDSPISDLPATKRLITTHSPTGSAIIHSDDATRWQPMRSGAVAMSLIYTTSTFPANLNSDTDIKAHDSKVASGGIGLVNGGGSVCRMVDFAPGNEPMMHRTQSLDYGVVLEGEVEMILDSGEVHLMRRGDVAVQRATMHAWRNPSETEWARMMFVLLDCQAVRVGDVCLKEQLAPGQHEMPASGNDA
ncbi:uncharacterized protein AB675_11393 [Cyphellophora attinorum]|uniref:Cupin type-2 domain-containing protein n=1 Tax=Cyphellophora attinorum TaxID=1664694 RepID=A0A0N1NYD7_9EURO|nr:uncharacterized protein AB675_11393 [Phialophora attinorum]KPI39952.1 hypothetical protein AB675_11393 [Phialophora attinorum]